MRFQALGQVAVIRGGEPIDLGSHKQRALFALLLINCNTVVSTDHILEALWADDAADRKSALQVYVSRLRSAIEPDRERGDASILRTQDPGYMLEVDPSTYDVAEFERLTSEARDLVEQSPAGASELFSEALALWNGSAFEDFAYDEFTQAERDRLEDARVWAIEERISADLARGLSGELVSELEVLRERYPLRERLVSHQMLALYRAGRPADALRAIASFRRHIGDELGIDPTPTLLRLEEQILLHDQRIQVSDRSPKLSLDRSAPAVNPYKGLMSFEADDAPSFFGRDALIADLLRTVGSGERLIALVGASGSGKSSVIRAGLIPALAKGAIPGSDGWLVASMMPGAHPFAELEAALLRSTIDGPPSLSEQLQDPEAGILRSVLRVLPDERSHLVLVIDQFEELFTMVDSDELRDRFLSNLITAIDDPRRRLTVVITLRADFYAQPLEHPKFGARLGNGIINVTQLSAEELEVAAVEPAKHAGVEFEPSLLGQLIADVGNQPGALPLFQYALTELFDRRSGDSLMSSTYRAMGGIDGALQRRADEVFEDLSDDEQDAARQLFLRLVSVSEHGQRSRRRVEAREIASLGIDTVTMQATIAKLGEHRLLSFDSDRLSGAPTVEVAHESLLTAWSMLETWIDESREDLRRHASLVVALREWQLADDNPEYLLPAARLAEFRGWQQTSNLRLNVAEDEFLEASEARLEAEKASNELERRHAAKGRRRLWALVAVLGGSLAVAAMFMLGVFATDPGATITFFGQHDLDRASEAIKSGLDRAEADLDLAVEDVRWTVGFQVEFEDLARNNPEFIILDTASTFAGSDLILEHADVRFGLIDPSDDLTPTPSNVSYLSFKNEEGAFLAGVAAASTTETNVVGFVGARQIPLIEEFRAGFEAGVAAVDPDVQVLSTFIAPPKGNGFRSPFVADVRATALYERGADVVFHAAGESGAGIFTAAEKYSEAEGTHVWGIGESVDQWFDLTTNLQDHVLTSIIKRHDDAAYTLAEHFLAGGSGRLVAELGIADRGFAYATSGDALSVETITTLDRFVEEISAGDITVPTEPTGSILVMDDLGGMVATLPAGTFAPDFEEFAAIAEGPHEVTSLGTPLAVDVVGDWFVQVNMLGHTSFSHPASTRQGDRDVVFLRPVEFADPTNPGGLFEEQVPWRSSEMEGLDGFEEWLAVLDDGIVSGTPHRAELAGREAVYFEAEITDASTCGPEAYCVGFLVNTTTTGGGISGWAFQPGFHQRVWVVDGGEHPPLVVIASTPTDDRSFQSEADDFLSRITIGDPGPHPLDDWLTQEE
ncbi:MAG: basic membrane lipoprotein Med (substrate-binding protein (PBP1-ABC) superfamily) [Verrucomicrobiales bacterium]|jgi:basic membrane lipoprotein Med (substrate-binding protein (PBP1-ABC) superfamily)/DNA-binding SARP family transcriptional activator